MITGTQVREALRLLKWSASDLTQRTKLAHATLDRVLSREGQAVITVEIESAIRTTLGQAGIIFVDENGEGPGVRLRKKR